MAQFFATIPSPCQLGGTRRPPAIREPSRPNHRAGQAFPDRHQLLQPPPTPPDPTTRAQTAPPYPQRTSDSRQTQADLSHSRAMPPALASATPEPGNSGDPGTSPARPRPHSPNPQLRQRKTPAPAPPKATTHRPRSRRRARSQNGRRQNDHTPKPRTRTNGRNPLNHNQKPRTHTAPTAIPSQNCPHRTAKHRRCFHHPRTRHRRGFSDAASRGQPRRRVGLLLKSGIPQRGGV